MTLSSTTESRHKVDSQPCPAPTGSKAARFFALTPRHWQRGPSADKPREKPRKATREGPPGEGATVRKSRGWAAVRRWVSPPRPAAWSALVGGPAVRRETAARATQAASWVTGPPPRAAPTCQLWGAVPSRCTSTVAVATPAVAAVAARPGSSRQPWPGPNKTRSRATGAKESCKVRCSRATWGRSRGVVQACRSSSALEPDLRGPPPHP